MAAWTSQGPAAFAFALIITFVCCRGSSFMSVPEFALLDVWFRHRPPREASPQIAIIGIETSEISRFRQEKLQGKHPDTCACTVILRDDLADGIVLAKRAGARVIGLDMIFEVECQHHDRKLLAALEQPQDTVVVSGTNPTPGKYNFVETPSFQRLERPVVASPVLYNPRGIVHGVRLIQQEPATNQPSPLVTLYHVRPPFALACYAAQRGCVFEMPEELSDNLVRCADTDIPVWLRESVFLFPPLRGHRHNADQSDVAQLEDEEASSKHAMLINWAGPLGTFPMYSMRTVLAATEAERKRWFAGKIVLVGTLGDRQLDPMGRMARKVEAPLLSQEGEFSMSGIEVHANALDTVLQRRFIKPAPLWLMWTIILCTSFATLVSFRYLHVAKSVAVMVVQIATLLLVAQYLMRYDFWLYAFIPIVAIFLSGISGAAWADALARRTAANLELDLEARDALTTTLVHDLKQPLAAINALAQVLRMQEQSGKGPPTPELIAKIQQQVQNALGDIDELLATDPNRELPLDCKPFDIAALAQDLAITQSMKSAKHDVDVQAPEGGLVVEGDPRYLGRALNNLLDNAIKYWPRGGTIIVEVKREPGRASVRVIDRGMGISQEGQERLFSRFYRAVPANLNIAGTGIGLFSVRRIMEAHRGSATVVSAPGEGSIFTLSLPIRVPARADGARHD